MLGNGLCKSKNCCFQNHFVNYRSIQVAAIILQTIPSFYAKFSEKSLYFSAKTYEKNIVSKDYCIAHHDNKTCSLRACKYQNRLPGEIEELLHKLDTFYFTYQHVDCLYTLCNNRLKGKIVAKSGNMLDNLQITISFHQKNRGVDKMPSIAKKRLLRKKFKQHFKSALQKNKSTQTSGSVFAEKVAKTKFDLELMENVDWFFDDHGNYDSISVSFKIKSL